MDRTNLHATAVIAGDRGILIVGASGSGKSMLALDLIDRCRVHGVHAALVADDQVWLSALNGHVLAKAPETIAGLVEIRGHGPARIGYEPCALVDLVVRLVEPQDAPRHREDVFEMVIGVTLPRLDLAARCAPAASNAIAAFLELFPDR